MFCFGATQHQIKAEDLAKLKFSEDARVASITHEGEAPVTRDSGRTPVTFIFCGEATVLKAYQLRQDGAPGLQVGSVASVDCGQKGVYYLIVSPNSVARAAVG